ncbi:MAG: hypothetical protein JWM76_4544 [Pseudonocardiales bacterium]|nr:hypothetical protein [Pseudonocardiales bacterium]
MPCAASSGLTARTTRESNVDRRRVPASGPLTGHRTVVRQQADAGDYPPSTAGGPSTGLPALVTPMSEWIGRSQVVRLRIAARLLAEAASSIASPLEVVSWAT